MKTVATLTPQRWRQIEAAFDAAADAPTAERGAILDRLCADDLDLRAEVEAMLAGTDAADDRLRDVVGREASGLVEEHTSSMIGRRLGPYRLVAELGRGGMGAVFRAERDDAYKTEVAIKLLRRELDTEQAIARFRDERQILATLEHPNIVRLLDGGTTDDGLPYLVMEHVKGVPIAQFVRNRDLSLRARIELTRAVCGAVQFAHQRLVVHRDLKPSNILVTADGTPKLLDFGIAKLLDEGATREAKTRTGMHLLTPEYASPEQARGEAVSVATDVYSLGAILYELLADRPAHQFTGANVLEALRVITETSPPRPSTVAPDERRRALAGDLDNIVLKALAKEPQRRYASVEQLSEDLRRHLDGLPVEARAGTWSYRAAKFVRRNRVLVIASFAVAAALGTATAISLQQAHRANAAAAEATAQAERAKRRFDDVRALANTLLFEVDDAIQELVGSTSARELIVTRALTYLDQLASEATNDPALARELALAYMKVGDVQGNMRVPNLGRIKDAAASYRKATELVERLVASGDTSTATRWVQIRAYAGTGSILWFDGATTKARERLRTALALASHVEPTSEAEHVTIERAYLDLVEPGAPGGIDPAELARDRQAMYDSAMAWAARDHSPMASYWTAIALGLQAQGALEGADPDTAVGELRQAREIMAKLAADHPKTQSYVHDLISTTRLVASLEAVGGDTQDSFPGIDDRASAERTIRHGIELAEKEVQRAGSDTRMTEILADLDLALGQVLIARDPAQALEALLRARAIYAGLPQPRFHDHVWHVRCALAEPLAIAGRRKEALDAIQAVTSDHPNQGLELGPDLEARCGYLVARARAVLGDIEGARADLERVAGVLRAARDARPGDVTPRVELANVFERLAAVAPSQRCTFGREGLGLWTTFPGSTPYVKRQIQKWQQVISTCPASP